MDQLQVGSPGEGRGPWPSGFGQGQSGQQEGQGAQHGAAVADKIEKRCLQREIWAVGMKRGP